MAVPNPTAKRHCPYCDAECPRCLMLERDIYDANNIRHFEYHYECQLPDGEKC